MAHPAIYTDFQAIFSSTWSRGSPGVPHILRMAMGSAGRASQALLSGLLTLGSRHGWRHRGHFDLEAHLMPGEAIRRAIAACLDTDC